MSKSRSKNPPRVLSAPEFARLVAPANFNSSSPGFIRAALHEMRTPLQIIQGLAELMDASNPFDRLPEQVEAIRREAARLTAIFDDVRYRRDLEDNCLSVQIAPVDVRMMVEELAATLETYYPAQLRTHYPRRLPKVLADPTHLRMILWTLLHNAARVGEAGRRRRDVIELTIRRSGRTLEFTVTDSGARIPVKPQAALSEPQASRPRLNLGQGVYVARELARAMRGDLYLKGLPLGEPFETARRRSVFVLTLLLAGDER